MLPELRNRSNLFSQLVGTVLEIRRLDARISRHAVADRALARSRAIFLLAMAELKTRGDVPTKVVINEAVNLAKRYGATDSFRFVNAVLDKTSKELVERTAPPAPAPALEP